MYFCYLDESGGCEPPDQTPNATPAMVILGLIIPARHIPALARDFLALKRRHFPGRFRCGPALDHVLTEVKGSDILQMTRKDSRDRRRQAKLVRHDLLKLVDGYGCQIVGRVWVKEKGKSLKSDPTYCYAVQDIARHYSKFLSEEHSKGVLIADGRTPGLNVTVAHSIFTQKWRTAGDPYPPLLEVPLFAHSDNHVGLQIADLIASTLVLPMAAAAYGAPPDSVHALPGGPGRPRRRPPRPAVPLPRRDGPVARRPSGQRPGLPPPRMAALRPGRRRGATDPRADRAATARPHARLTGDRIPSLGSCDGRAVRWRRR
ncbi:DUF3800 domain-containing protein [Actinoallomurus purpureus]|uniref:DUF3800 domain-containing protein n=1 Tax=Actinoallomurus purpureus TaxID=478114 RepID=UPI0020932649|nr:DUF3800 domain-containing protein [Actinoallomurus purpureus]MCO6005939.1 DUF3800 domain-containing protein [Actinoallomurus purpureus]